MENNIIILATRARLVNFMGWVSNEKLDRALFIFWAIRMLIDLAVGYGIWQDSETLGIGIGCFLVMSILPLFLLFGLVKEYFPARFGRKVDRFIDPVAWWTAFVIIVIMHFAITGLFAWDLSVFAELKL